MFKVRKAKSAHINSLRKNCGMNSKSLETIYALKGLILKVRFEIETDFKSFHFRQLIVE